jgi:hypothetical protein
MALGRSVPRRLLGVHLVRGKLPFTIVHEQRGKLSFDFRMADGVRGNFGVEAKVHPGMTAFTRGMTGWFGTNWQGRIEAAD